MPKNELSLHTTRKIATDRAVFCFVFVPSTRRQPSYSKYVHVQYTSNVFLALCASDRPRACSKHIRTSEEEGGSCVWAGRKRIKRRTLIAFLEGGTRPRATLEEKEREKEVFFSGDRRDVAKVVEGYFAMRGERESWVCRRERPPPPPPFFLTCCCGDLSSSPRDIWRGGRKGEEALLDVLLYSYSPSLLLILLLSYLCTALYCTPLPPFPLSHFLPCVI